MSTQRGEGRREPLDCVVRLVTPERIVIEHPLAGPSRRFMAYLVDLVLLVVLVSLAFFLFLFLAMGSQAGIGPALVALFRLDLGLRRLLRGAVQWADGGQASDGNSRRFRTGGADQRCAGGLAQPGGNDGRPVSLFLSARPGEHDSVIEVSAAGRSRGRHDGCHRRAALAARVTRIVDPEVTALIPWLPGRIAAGSDLARVLSDYVEARSRFGPLRRAEMAERLATPLRKRFGIPAQYSADAVLCAVYHQIFVGG